MLLMGSEGYDNTAIFFWHVAPAHVLVHVRDDAALFPITPGDAGIALYMTMPGTRVGARVGARVGVRVVGFSVVGRAVGGSGIAVSIHAHIMTAVVSHASFSESRIVTVSVGIPL